MKSIRVYAKELVDSMDCTEQDLPALLDTATGAVILDMRPLQPPPEQVGDGRLGVRDGKRFIVIPRFDEEIARDVRDYTQHWKQAANALGIDDPEDMQELRSSISEAAASFIPARWMESLRMPVQVEWVEVDGYLRTVWEPDAGEWINVDAKFVGVYDEREPIRLSDEL